MLKAPDPGAAARASATRSRCETEGRRELRNPWRCTVDYRSGSVARFVVTIENDGSYVADYAGDTARPPDAAYGYLPRNNKKRAGLPALLSYDLLRGAPTGRLLALVLALVDVVLVATALAGLVLALSALLPFPPPSTPDDAGRPAADGEACTSIMLRPWNA